MASTNLTFYVHGHTVIRESDGHLVLVIEMVTESGNLVGLSVLDPRDLDREEND